MGRLVDAYPFGKIKVNNASADQQVERERGVCVCVCVCVISSVCFTLGTRLRFSSLQKFLIVRDV